MKCFFGLVCLGILTSVCRHLLTTVARYKSNVYQASAVGISIRRSRYGFFGREQRPCNTVVTWLNRTGCGRIGVAVSYIRLQSHNPHQQHYNQHDAKADTEVWSVEVEATAVNQHHHQKDNSYRLHHDLPLSTGRKMRPDQKRPSRKSWGGYCKRVETTHRQLLILVVWLTTINRNLPIDRSNHGKMLVGSPYYAEYACQKWIWF